MKWIALFLAIWSFSVAAGRAVDIEPVKNIEEGLEDTQPQKEDAAHGLTIANVSLKICPGNHVMLGGICRKLA